MLNIVQNGNYPNLKIKNLAQKAVSKLYKEDKRLFFNVGSGDVNSPKGIVKYLGRYLARAPIGGGVGLGGVEFHDGVLVFQAHFGLVHAVYAFEDAGNAFHAAAAGHAFDV